MRSIFDTSKYKMKILINYLQLWTGFFTLGVAYLNQNVLQLDSRVNGVMTMAKKQRILDRYGDMRIQMAYQIMSLWSHLGELKHHFIPGKTFYF